MRRRSRPKQHVRRVKSGKRVSVNPGVKKKVVKKKRSSAKPQDSLSARDKKAVVSQSYLEIVSQLKKGGRARIPELGVFTVKKKPARKARKGVNPFTKETMVFKAKPASRVVKFRPSKKLKETISL